MKSTCMLTAPNGNWRK